MLWSSAGFVGLVLRKTGGLGPFVALLEVHEDALRRFPVSGELARKGFRLSQQLFELSAARATSLHQQRAATSARDALLYEVQTRLKHTRAALRYAHRTSPDVLHRIGSEYKRQKRRGKTQ